MNKFTRAIIAASAMASMQTYGALVLNGDFEQPVVGSGTYGIYASIPGWTATSGDGIEIQNNAAGAPHSPNQFVELDSNNNSSMVSTAFSATPGAHYLSFFYSPRPGVSESSNGIEVYFNNSLLDTVTGNGGGTTVWALKQYSVNANANGNTIGFKAVGTSDSLGGYIDDVSFSAVPEPSTYLAGISALGMLCLFGRGNRKQ